MRRSERRSPVRRGRLINGRYRVEDVLGHGGMGMVMSARDLRRDVPVALKLPHRVHGRDAARLVAEARAVERLTSPHVTRLYDAGTFDDDGVEVPFLALEYVDGVDLATWLRAKGRIAPSDAAAIVLQACDAIGEAHALGLVHRDVKPANLMLTASPDGELVVKVLDFGIARPAGERHRGGDEHGLTSTGDLVGSPSYMAPEQLRPSDAVDARSDVWALGVVLFEAVVGRPPFEAAGLPELCLHILLDEPPPLPNDCPTATAEVIRRCLDKLPDARFQSARELAEALQPIAAPAPTMCAEELELAALENAAGEDGVSVDAPADRGAPARPSVRRSNKAAFAFGAIALAIAVTLAANRQPKAQSPAEAAPAAMTRESTSPPTTHVVRESTAQLANRPAPVAAPVSVDAAASARRTRADKRLPSAHLHDQPAVDHPASTTGDHTSNEPAAGDPLASPF
jgi:eukaryotic-like serine/threonine-protein kinase